MHPKVSSRADVVNNEPCLFKTRRQSTKQNMQPMTHTNFHDPLSMRRFAVTEPKMSCSIIDEVASWMDGILCAAAIRDGPQQAFGVA